MRPKAPCKGSAVASSVLLQTLFVVTAGVCGVRSQQIPNLNATALRWPASSAWEGNDGTWGTFFMRVGTPSQIIRVLPATTWQEIWVVDKSACGNAAPEDCYDKRGQTFNRNSSSTWAGKGDFRTDLAKDLGNVAVGAYGQDRVGISNTDSAVTLNKQVVVSLDSNKWYFGLFGLGNQPTNFTDFNDPQPSFLTSLYDAGLIPSLSWGYQAGAVYRGKTSSASLIFGGYDKSKYIDNEVVFTQSNDFTYAFMVAMSSLRVSGIYVNNVKGNAELLDASWRRTGGNRLISIDSSTPYMWLPNTTCAVFESALNLTWTESVGLYLLSEEHHNRLVDANPTFTFTIGDTAEQESNTMTIEIPYRAFSLEASGPEILGGSNSRSWYFPLKRLPQDGNPRLGRAFMQEVYLFAEYHYGTFKLYQADFSGGPENIVTHLPLRALGGSEEGGTPIGAIVGGVVGGVAAVAAVLGGLWWRRKKQQAAKDPTTDPHYVPEIDGNVQAPGELDGAKGHENVPPVAAIPGLHEMHGKAAEARFEADGTPIRGTAEARFEADGTPITGTAEPRFEADGTPILGTGARQEYAELSAGDVIYEMPANEVRKEG